MTNRPIVWTAVAMLALAACGADGVDADVDLPPAALEGRDVVRSNGCAACHGANGQGGVGPSFVGLFGTEVPLESGERETADREYLAESIREPSAQIVDGYNLPMPTNDLDDDEIDAVIAYIEALAPPADATGGTAEAGS